MTTETKPKCTELVDSYPLRLAGQECWRPAKFWLAWNMARFGIDRPKHVCGMHRNVLLRQNYREIPDPLSPDPQKESRTK